MKSTDPFKMGSVVAAATIQCFLRDILVPIKDYLFVYLIQFLLKLFFAVEISLGAFHVSERPRHPS